MTKGPFIAGAIILLMGVGTAVAFTITNNAHKSEIVRLQNEVAARDVTIEHQAGVYSRLAHQAKDLKLTLDDAAAQNNRLVEELRKTDAQLLTAQTVAVKWKKAYEALVVATQTEVTTPEGVVRKKVEFQKDFGYVISEGYTLTDPPEAFVRVKQGRPLRLSVVMTQHPDKSWRAYATSSEENVGVDIEVAGVNPTMLESKWYEKIGLHADVGFGSGVLVGVGASYKIGKFTIGPSFWGAMNWDLKPQGYVGATMGWNPFQRD